MEPGPSTRSGTLGPNKGPCRGDAIRQQLTTEGGSSSPSPACALWLENGGPGRGAHQHSAGRGEMQPAQPDPSMAWPSSYRSVSLELTGNN